MTDERQREGLPLDHIVARWALVAFVVAILAASAALIILRGPAELEVGKAIWAAVRHWAIPW